MISFTQKKVIYNFAISFYNKFIRYTRFLISIYYIENYFVSYIIAKLSGLKRKGDVKEKINF